MFFFIGRNINIAGGPVASGRNYGFCERSACILLGFGERIDVIKSPLNFFLGQFMIGKFSTQVGIVGCHVHQTVATPVEEDNLFFSFLLGLDGLTNNLGDGVGCFRGADEPFSLSECDAGLKGFKLRYGNGADQVVED